MIDLLVFGFCAAVFAFVGAVTWICLKEWK